MLVWHMCYLTISETSYIIWTNLNQKVPIIMTTCLNAKIMFILTVNASSIVQLHSRCDARLSADTNTCCEWDIICWGRRAAHGQFWRKNLNQNCFALQKLYAQKVLTEIIWVIKSLNGNNDIEKESYVTL